MQRGILFGCILPLVFVGSCAALLRPAATIADPMTRRSMDYDVSRPFPVLIVNGKRAVIHDLFAPYSTPAIEAGDSFLVPRDARAAIAKTLNEQRQRPDGEWVLDVSELAPGMQRVELYWEGDGYDGGVYEATATTIKPLYRKITGPAFALVFGSIAIGLNVLIWLAGAAVFLLVRRRRAPSRAADRTPDSGVG